MVQYTNILGFPIDEIDFNRTSISSQVKSDDLFLMSQQILSNVSPTRTYTSHGNTYTNEYRSVNTTYNHLSNNIFNDICSLYGIKNMAWENSAEYSLDNHIHNYSKTSISAYMTPNVVGQYSPDDRCYVNLSNIATFTVDTKNYTISMPHIQMYDQPRPYIGQLKFLVTSSFTEVNIYAENFDGWTYPNGASIPISRFPQAYEVFGDTYGGDDTHFNIPNICNFLKPTASNPAQDIHGVVPYKMPLIKHCHSISKPNIDIEATIKMKYIASQNASKGPACHGSSSSKPNTQDTYEIGFIFKNFKITNLNCVNASGGALEHEIYPAFNYIPVMIYIGRPYNGK